MILKFVFQPANAAAQAFPKVKSKNDFLRHDSGHGVMMINSF
jgi:hypothetical protein